MSYNATVIQVLIASPVDTAPARNEILSEISRWNGRYSQGRSFVLSPWLYELHSTPILGDRPQAVINSQGVDKSDVVIALFDGRLGTDTGVSMSGTVEEIDRALEKGVPVHVFFSDGGLPRETDPEQLQKVIDFKAQLGKKGLYSTYKDKQDAARQVIAALEYDLDSFEQLPTPVPASGAKIQVSHSCEKEPKGLDKNGQMRYRYRIRDLRVKNTGDEDAKRFRFFFGEEARIMAHIDTPMEDGWTDPIDLNSGSEFGFICFPMNGRSNLPIKATWLENDVEMQKSFIVPIQ